MLFWLHETWLLALLAIVNIPTVISAAVGDSNADLYARLPDPLTLDTFDKSLQEGYHLVEFFSPFCHHCAALLPTWVDLFESHTGSKNIQIHQVNCVSDGDLCDREAIKYYPIIRFYGPGSKLLGSLNSNVRTLDIIEDFIDNQLMDWTPSTSSPDGINDLSELFESNKLLDSMGMAKLIIGKNIKKPTIVSLWPSIDSELNNQSFQSDQNSLKLFKWFPLSYTFRNMWNLSMKSLNDLISNDSIDFKFFNCQSNPEICSSFKFDSLVKTKSSDTMIPKILMFLPDYTDGGHAIHYEIEMDLEYNPLNQSVKQFTHWVRRVINNGNFQNPTEFNKIKDFINTKTSLDPADSIGSFEDYSKIGFVLVNDPKSEVPEDDLIFKHLLQSISNLQTDVYLFKTHDIDIVEKFLETQDQSISNDYINLIPKDGIEPMVFDKELFISKTHSTYPMIICLKSMSLISPIYQSFQSEDIRSYDDILNFIKMNSLPIIDRLTISNTEIHFPIFNKNIHSKSQNVLIHLTDFQPNNFFNAEFYMSWVYHKFQYLNQKFQFAKTLVAREKKKENVDKLKKQDADSVDIILEMKEPIESAFKKVDNLLNVVYVDIKEFPNICQLMNWSNIDARKYKQGDSIIISKFQNSYWDKFNNFQINQERPYEVVELLEEISFKYLSGETLRGHFWVWIIFFYLILAGALFICFKMYRKWAFSNSLKRDRKKSLGLLGVNPSEVSKAD